MPKDKKPQTHPDQLSIKTEEKKDSTRHARSKKNKKDEYSGGRYWGVVFLLLTVVLSLVFHFFR